MKTFEAKEVKWPFRTPGNKGEFKGEVNNLPSMTVPDMAMTIKEIMMRFATHRPVAMANDLTYTGDQPLPNMRFKDPMEQADLARANAAEIERLQKEMDEINIRRRKRREEKDKQSSIAQQLAKLKKEEEAEAKRERRRKEELEAVEQ